MAGEQFELWGTCFLRAQEILGGDLDGLTEWAGLAKQSWEEAFSTGHGLFLSFRGSRPDVMEELPSS